MAESVSNDPLLTRITEKRAQVRTFGLSSPSWQILCMVASVSSIMATVSTQLLKSHNIEEHVSRA